MFGLKIYSVRKNKHYSGFRFRPFIRKKELKAWVCFTDSCRYYTEDLQLKEQVNKLFGFGSILHHRNSYRIGWRYNQENDVIDLFEYFYIKGQRHIKKFDSIRIGQTRKLKVKSKKTVWLGVRLWLYYGGVAKAPKNIYVKMLFD